jgi:hypothetical protein
MHFEILSEISHVETFASGSGNTRTSTPPANLRAWPVAQMQRNCARSVMGWFRTHRRMVSQFEILKILRTAKETSLKIPRTAKATRL